MDRSDHGSGSWGSLRQLNAEETIRPVWWNGDTMMGSVYTKGKTKLYLGVKTPDLSILEMKPMGPGQD